MSPKRKARRTNPVVFVFCEGETEQKYVDVLRQHFRVPIQIVTKVLNTRISARTISTYVKNCGYPEADKVFLFYDGDRSDILERLNTISEAEIMLSCPCIEVWFLIHFTEHCPALDSDNMLKALRKHLPDYKKGQIQGKLREYLTAEWKVAAQRARALTPKANPSTTAYLLPEYIERKKMNGEDK